MSYAFAVSSCTRRIVSVATLALVVAGTALVVAVGTNRDDKAGVAGAGASSTTTSTSKPGDTSFTTTAATTPATASPGLSENGGGPTTPTTTTSASTTSSSPICSDGKPASSPPNRIQGAQYVESTMRFDAAEVVRGTAVGVTMRISNPHDQYVAVDNLYGEGWGYVDKAVVAGEEGWLHITPKPDLEQFLRLCSGSRYYLIPPHVTVSAAGLVGRRAGLVARGTRDLGRHDQTGESLRTIRRPPHDDLDRVRVHDDDKSVTTTLEPGLRDC